MKLKLMENGDSGGTKAERKSTAACKSHSEAERRRRQRINAHLSTLRSLLPNTTKMDKASLLAEVVRHVTELRKRAAEAAAESGGGGGGSEAWAFPGETDEVSLGYYEGNERLIKATLCCEDRPSLNRDLTEAIGSVRGRVVRAEMATVGGRTKSVVVMQRGGGGGGGGGEAELGNLRRALKAVVENRASGFGSTQSQVFPLHKRPRFSTSINASSSSS